VKYGLYQRNRLNLAASKIFFFASLCAAVSLLLVFPLYSAEKVSDAPDPDSDEFPVFVMNKVDDQYRGTKSHGIMNMQVKTKHWKRSMSLETWSLGKQYSLVRILAPKKEKGTATLKANKDLFTYLSKTGRTIKITSGMMGASWMGSHFTNDDIIRNSRLSEDYDIELTFEGEESGSEIYRFTLTPKPEAPVVWGKMEVTVRTSDLQPLRQVFFDEDGKEIRLLEFFDHTEVDGRLMPLKMVMTPQDGSDEYTKVSWKEIDFNVDLDKGFFSIQRLKSM